MGQTGVVLTGLPEELQAISLTEAFPHLGMRPWDWQEIGVKWIAYLNIWTSVQREATKLHQQLFG